jgi:hypothetical protein
MTAQAVGAVVIAICGMRLLLDGLWLSALLTFSSTGRRPSEPHQPASQFLLCLCNPLRLLEACLRPSCRTCSACQCPAPAGSSCCSAEPGHHRSHHLPHPVVVSLPGAPLPSCLPVPLLHSGIHW